MSRLTFRDKATDVAWQKQLRDRYVGEGTPPVPHLDVKRAEVRRVSRKLAEQIIYKYEWLGDMSNTMWHYGIFFGSYCAGVCCVGTMSAVAGPYVHKTFSVERDDMRILARGANVHWSPKGANSKLVSWTCRLVAKDTGGKVLLAYSDTDAGEIGTIYQACNWAYVGRGIGRHLELIAPSGKIINETVINKLAKQHRKTYRQQLDALLAAGWQAQKPNPKHRYVYILDKSDKALAARVERMRQPYPKRATSIDSDAPCVQQGDGGARPTVAPQPEP